MVFIRHSLIVISFVIVLCLQIPTIISLPEPSHNAAREASSYIRKKCLATVFIPPIRIREDLGGLLRSLDKRIGAELGVQAGNFANSLMRRWKKVDEFVMVDLWAHQENYIEAANVNNQQQEALYQQSRSVGNQLVKAGILAKFTMCRNLTVACALQFPDNYFNFIYVDARHDYKGVLDDLRAWWPKLKMGGIFAGHDYTEQSEPYGASCPQTNSGNEDWTKNYDGTVDETGRVTKGGVDDFFSDRFGDLKGCPRQLTITYREPAWNTWIVGK
jgi:hypothetical protein